MGRLVTLGLKALTVVGVLLLVGYQFMRFPSEIHILRDASSPDKACGVLFRTDPPGADVVLSGVEAPIGKTPLVMTSSAVAGLCPGIPNESAIEVRLRLGADEQTLTQPLKRLAADEWRRNPRNNFLVKMHPGLAWRLGPGLRWTLHKAYPWFASVLALVLVWLWSAKTPPPSESGSDSSAE